MQHFPPNLRLIIDDIPGLRAGYICETIIFYLSGQWVYDTFGLCSTKAWNPIVEVTVFNRGLTLFMSDDDRGQRIHRVLCRLDKEQIMLRSDSRGVE